jgi:methionyl-tRNA synthetase
VGADLYAVLESCRWIGVLLTPLLPDLSGRILAQLACPALSSGALWPASQGRAEAERMAAASHSAWQDSRRWGLLPSPFPLPEAAPVMQRLELLDPL